MLWDDTEIEMVLGRIEKRLVYPLFIVLEMATFADLILLKLYVKPPFLTSRAKPHLFFCQF